MKEAIRNLNKDFGGNTRLSVIVLLYMHGALSHSELKERAELTDGNIASHIKSLEQGKYVRVNKAIVNKKTATSYAITAKGKSDLLKHVRALRIVVDSVV